MEVGKISETVLKRSIFKQIKHRRSEVLVPPNIGEDCSIVQLKDDEVFVISTDPITGASHNIGSLAIHITANDLACSGAEPIGVMVTILLKEGSHESELRDIMKEIECVCQSLNMEVLGGHTEITKAVNQTIISITGIGKASSKEIIKTSGAKPGQAVIMTKWAGIEGTSIIAKEKEEELLKRYRPEFIDQAKSLDQYFSVVNEARIGKQYSVTAMHDVTEGGIFGALWELASASKVGMEIHLDKIPVKQETIEVCETFDLNPYKLISSGCMLMTTFEGEALQQALQNAGIEGTIIGKITDKKDRVIISKEDKKCMEPPKADELYKVI